MKLFKVADVSGENEVTLEVDETKLTVERATEINNARSKPGDRTMAQMGIVEEAVVRLFGAEMIALMLAEGGFSFGRACPTGARLSKKLHEEEGWGGADETPYGWCGIRVVGAEIYVPGFDDVFLSEVTA